MPRDSPGRSAASDGPTSLRLITSCSSSALGSLTYVRRSRPSRPVIFSRCRRRSASLTDTLRRLRSGREFFSHFFRCSRRLRSCHRPQKTPSTRCLRTSVALIGPVPVADGPGPCGDGADRHPQAPHRTTTKNPYRFVAIIRSVRSETSSPPRARPTCTDDRGCLDGTVAGVRGEQQRMAFHFRPTRSTGSLAGQFEAQLSSVH